MPGYTYRGKLTGNNDPWQQPSRPTPRTPTEPKPTTLHPRPDQPRIPNILWDPKSNRWRVRIKRDGKQISFGTYPADNYQAAIDALKAAEATHPRTNHGPGLPIQPCGTNAAYARHIEHGQKPCGPCVKARTKYTEAHRRKAA